MPIEQVFEKVDDAPEFLRSALVENNGKFVFRAELASETTGLKSALDAERKRAAEAEKALKGFEGIDPAKAREMAEAARKAEEEKAKAQGDWDNWKNQMTAQFEQEKATLTGQLKEIENALNQELITSRAVQAIAAKEGESTLLLPHLKATTLIENGQRVVRIVDERNAVRYGKSGAPMTIEERIDEMYNDPIFGRAFRASKAGGSGSEQTRGGSDGGKTITRAAFGQLSPADQMAHFKAGGTVID